MNVRPVSFGNIVRISFENLGQLPAARKIADYTAGAANGKLKDPLQISKGLFDDLKVHPAIADTELLVHDSGDNPSYCIFSGNDAIKYTKIREEYKNDFVSLISSNKKPSKKGSESVTDSYENLENKLKKFVIKGCTGEIHLNPDGSAEINTYV